MDVWSPRGQTPIVRVHPGRDKVGYYGTLNLHTQREIVTRTSVFNAATSAQHLRRSRGRHQCRRERSQAP